MIEFDAFSAIFGSFLSLIAQIIFFIIQNVSNHLGRFDIFCDVLRYVGGEDSLGIRSIGLGPLDFLFELPIRITIQNRKKISKTIRNLRVAVYSNGEFCFFMTPVRESKFNKDNTEYFYSYKYDFYVPANGLLCETCVFHCFGPQFMNKTNIEFRLFYYNEKNKEVSVHLMYLPCLTSSDIKNMDFSESIKLNLTNSKNIMNKFINIVLNKEDTKGLFLNGTFILLLQFSFYSLFVVCLIFLFASIFIFFKELYYLISSFSIYGLFKICLYGFFSILSFLYAIIFRGAGNDVEREKDRDYIISVFSGLTGLAAIFVSLVISFISNS